MQYGKLSFQLLNKKVGKVKVCDLFQETIHTVNYFTSFVDVFPSNLIDFQVMENTEKKYLLEALIFISGDPVSIKELSKLTELTENDVSALIGELMHEYNTRRGGLLIAEVANGFQMVTNPDFAPWIKKLRKSTASSKLSQAALETLAIVAYKQPLTKPEIEELRGVNSDGVVKSLLDKRLIKILGKKEVPGKPLLYGTSREFLQFFGLKDLSELPTLKELKREEEL